MLQVGFPFFLTHHSSSISHFFFFWLSVGVLSGPRWVWLPWPSLLEPWECGFRSFFTGLRLSRALCLRASKNHVIHLTGEVHMTVETYLETLHSAKSQRQGVGCDCEHFLWMQFGVSVKLLPGMLRHCYLFIITQLTGKMLAALFKWKEGAGMLMGKKGQI